MTDLEVDILGTGTHAKTVLGNGPHGPSTTAVPNPSSAPLGTDVETQLALRRNPSTKKAVILSRLDLPQQDARLTHYLFRYPAKFHPPVVRALLDTYTRKGQLVLDPFCGSGTLLVEAKASGRSSIGVDIDPVAVLVAQAKIARYQIPQLLVSLELLLKELQRHRRDRSEYSRLMFEDLTDSEYQHQIAPVRAWVPEIPNLLHWFRRYVVVDLAHIREAIDGTVLPQADRLLLQVVFASIIRNASNADPVPVSGLEVTSYMKRRDAKGRLIDPFALFERAAKRAIASCGAFAAQAVDGTMGTAMQGDAARLDEYLSAQVDAVITSPPYHGAVDYYRRHKLEMFWLGQTKDVKDRLALLNAYVGRPSVPRRHPYVSDFGLTTRLAREWETLIRSTSPERANAFRHYIVAMTKFFRALARRLPAEAPAIVVVGHSAWGKGRIPTTDLFTEIVGEYFQLEEVLWYPVRNRYMSYSRRNEADINTEYVLVFKRTSGPAEPTV